MAVCDPLPSLSDLPLICRSAIQLFSLVITYPALNATDEDAVRQFYSSSHELGWTWNSTGSGDMNSEPGLDFQLKLQDFSTCMFFITRPTVAALI